MKTELTSKRLAPYLPYRLNTDKGILSLLEVNYCECKKAMLATRFSIESIKPILRPISDITKEIEVNGEKFVPIDFIVDNFHISIAKNSPKDEFLIDCKIGSVLKHSYNIIQKLLEWHFDIFGLIEQDLAISIHDFK